MGDQILKDRHNNVIGKIRETSSRIEIRDRHNKLLGFYEPHTNLTKDNHSRIVGKGNLLTSLLDDWDD